MKMVSLLVALLLSVSGCGFVRNLWTDVKQNTVMLHSTITLYACDGDTIRTWQTKANVETNGGEAWWVGDDGVQHHIAGTFLISGQ